MVTNKCKRYFFFDSYTLFLWWMRWFVSHLIYLNLTKPTMQQCFHPSAKHLLCRYITPNFVGHSFRVEGSCWNLVLFCQFTVVHFDLISNIFLCRYASRTLRMKLLTWCRVISRAGLFGSGLSLSKYFWPFSGLHTKRFYNIKSNDFFSWRRFVVLTTVNSVSEVIVIFFS